MPLQTAWQRVAAANPETLRVISAYTIDQARELFAEHAVEIDLIYLDGCLPGQGEMPNSLPLIAEFRSTGYTGPIVTISSDPGYQSKMETAGATDRLDKGAVMSQLFELAKS